MRLFPISLVLMLAFSACKSRVTNSAIKHGDVLKSSVEDFEKNRKKLAEKVTVSIAEAQEALAGESPDLPDISKDWEKEWTSIQSRYNKLKADFERVGSSSEAYFGQLNDLSQNINNEQLRNDELSKNAELESRWRKTYEQAKVSVEKVTEVLKSGNDFHMVLVASSIRQKLEQNVVELGVIAEQAKVLLQDLEAFTEAGRQLVEG